MVAPRKLKAFCAPLAALSLLLALPSTASSTNLLNCLGSFKDQFGLLNESFSKNQARIEELKKIPVSKEIHTKPGGEITINRRGLAPEYKIFKSTESTVWRHYTTKEAAAEIRATGYLNAGPRPSAITINGSIEVNPDIYGVFFTDAVQSRRAPPDLVAVDFQLPEGYTIIQTFQDEYVIVGPRPIQPWLLNEINKNPQAHANLLEGLVKNAEGKYEIKEPPLRVIVRPVN